MAKPVAVVFPVVLLMVDLYMGGRIRRNDILNKIPYLIIALAAGFLALQTQSAIIKDITRFPILSRITLPPMDL